MKRTDLELVTHALDLAVSNTEALIGSTGEGFDDEDDAWMWDFSKRVLVAAKVGDLSAIHAECESDEAREAAEVAAGKVKP